MRTEAEVRALLEATREDARLGPRPWTSLGIEVLERVLGERDDVEIDG